MSPQARRTGGGATRGRARSGAGAEPSRFDPADLWRKFRTALLPPARQRPTTAQVLPVIIFIAVFVLLAIGLSVSNILLYTRLWPFLLIALAPWFWWLHVAGYAGLRGVRGQIALWSRFILLALLILVLTEPRKVQSDERLTVVFAVDVSASIQQRDVDAAMGYVARVGHTEKPEEDMSALVYFGKDAAVQLPPSQSLPTDELRAVNVEVDREGTDLAKALSLSAAMIPETTNGRIVLVTDGVETDGSLAGVLDDLKAKGISVDVLPVPYSHDREVWLERLELPQFVKEDETYEAAVILSSLSDGEGTLMLEENGQPMFTEPMKVKFKAGKNRFSVPIALRTAGYYEYKATIIAPDVVGDNGVPVKQDYFRANNEAISHLYLEGKGQVLLVTDPEGSEDDWKSLNDALKQAGRSVQVASAFSIPRDPLGLLSYDAIILCNVPREAMDEAQLAAVHDAVYHQGSGLLMVGGQNSFGPGGWARTPVEDALPVEMDIKQRKVMPKGALVIILHTCEFADGNTWAKRITKKAIQILNPQDEVGVLVYDWNGGDKWLFELTEAGKYDQLVPLINGAQPGDMPSFVPTMERAHLALSNSDAATKHVIIISDGDPSPAPGSLLQKYQGDKISVSTVAISPHGPNSLPSIASLTGGKYYLAADPSKLPAIFIKEAKTLRRSAIQNKTFTPVVMPVSSPILKDIQGLPKLHGYTLVSAKPRSQTILDGPEPQEEELDPVLSKWRYGTGAGAAFTSDLSTNWGRDWVSWEKYQAFVQQLMLDISRVSKLGTLRMRSFVAGGQGVILVEDYADKESFLQMVAHVDGPGLIAHDIELKQVGPNRYEGRFPLDGTGRYNIRAKAAGRDEIAHGALVVPYSREYLRFRDDPITLDAIAARTGGRRINTTTTGEELFGQDRQVKRTSQPFVLWMLVLLACMIPIDVGLRRVQIDWDVIRGWFATRRGDEKSEETFTALLHRKRSVKTEIDESHGAATANLGDEPGWMAEEETSDGKPPPLPSSLKAKAEQRARQAAEADQQKDDASVTNRLLAAKKRAQRKTPGGGTGGTDS